MKKIYMAVLVIATLTGCVMILKDHSTIKLESEMKPVGVQINMGGGNDDVGAK